jgi:DNA-binding CsgD family transcriptional regulator
MTTNPLPNRRWVTSGSALTPRERQVLHLVSYGLTDAAIGRRLYLTINTVKTHMRAILTRLDAVDRTHAVRRGFELGHLTTADDDEVAS